jgi:hypothetical protein
MSFSRRTLLAALSTGTALRVAAASSKEEAEATVDGTNERKIEPAAKEADDAKRLSALLQSF